MAARDGWASTRARKAIVLWAPVVAWMILIFALSSVPTLGEPGRHRLRLDPRTMGHLLIFAMLGALVLRALWDTLPQRREWWALVFGMLYAVSDEIHQAFVPGRTSSLIDMAVDTLGVVVGVFVWARIGSGRIRSPFGRFAHRIDVRGPSG